MNENNIKNNSVKTELIIAFTALAIFILNDFLFLTRISAFGYYLFDYLFKGLLTIAIILNTRKMENGFDFLKVKGIKTIRLIAWILALIVIGVLIDEPLWNFLSGVLPEFSFQLNYPAIQNQVLWNFDLYIGLLLVAFAEEYIFRFSLIKIFDRKLPAALSAAAVILLFGLAHWSLGPTAILCTALWGILPLVSVKRLKTLLPAMIAHFITNYIAFSGIGDLIFGQ